MVNQFASKWNVVLFSCVIALLLAVFDCIPTVSADDEPELTLQGGHYAFIIGVHKYDDSSGLCPPAITHNDVSGCAKFLSQAACIKENIIVVTECQYNLVNFAPVAAQAFSTDNDETDRLEKEVQLLLSMVNRNTPLLESLLAEKSNIQPVKTSAMEFFNNLAQLLMDLERNAEARTFLNKILTVYGDRDDYSDLEPYGRLLLAHAHGNLGWIDLLEGKFEDSIRQSEKGLQIDETQGWIRKNLANAYLCHGQYEEAKHLYLKMFRGADDKTEFLSEISAELISLPDQGKIQQAVEKLKHILSIKREELGSQHQEVEDLLKILAVLQDALDRDGRVPLGRHPDFVGSQHQMIVDLLKILAQCKTSTFALDATNAINFSEKIYGKQHPVCAEMLNEIGLLYVDLGAFERAEANYLEASDIRKKTLGNQHPDYAASLNNLGVLYRRMGNYENAETFLVKATDITRKILGKDHPDHAIYQENLSGLYILWYENKIDENNIDQAMIVAQRLLLIQTKQFGEAHWRVTEADVLISQAKKMASLSADQTERLSELPSLNDQMHQLKRQGHYREMIPIGKKGEEITRDVLGRDSSKHSYWVNQLAIAYYYTGSYAEAVKRLEEGLQIKKKLFGVDHPKYVLGLYNLGTICHDVGKKKKSIDCYREAVRIAEVVSERSRLYPVILTSLASSLMETYEFDEAEEVLIKARDHIRQGVGSEHPDFAQCILELGYLYEEKGEFAKAEEYTLEALDITERYFGNKHPNFALKLNSLAMYWANHSQISRAESALAEVLGIFRERLGREHPQCGTILLNLGITQLKLGKIADAEKAMLEAKEIIEKARGTEHKDLVSVWVHLSALYGYMGDSAKSDQFLKRAEAVSEKLEETDYELTQVVLGRKALRYQEKGDFKKAEEIFKDILEKSRKIHGSKHESVGHALDDLGGLYIAMGDYENAEPILVEGEKCGSKDDIDYAYRLAKRAMVYHFTGRYDEAEALYLEAAERCKILVGTDHNIYAEFLQPLGGFYQDTGDFTTAANYFQQAFDNSLRTARTVIPNLSEARALRFSQSLTSSDSLLCTLKQLDREAAHRAYEIIFKRRGLVTQILRDRRKIVGEDQETQKLIQQLHSTQKHLALLTLMIAQPKQREWRLQRLEELSDEKERLETQIAQRSVELSHRKRIDGLGLGELAKKIPNGTAIVDFCKIQFWVRPQDGKTAPAIDSQYEAFVLRAIEKEPYYKIDWVHLGAAAPIEEAAGHWRTAIQKATYQYLNRDDKRGLEALEEIGQPAHGLRTEDANGETLRKLVWLPIEPLLAGCQHVAIVPDGAMSRIPWSALPGKESGTYLIEDYSVSTLESSRQMFEFMTAPTIPGEKILLVGGVRYDQSGEKRNSPPKVEGKQVQMSRSLGPAFSGKRPQWGYLTGTLGEVEAIASIEGFESSDSSVMVLKGASADENRVSREMADSRYIHLATHGFFASEEVKSLFGYDPANEQLSSRDEEPLTSDLADVTDRNPLLLSGLVMSGANLSPQMDQLGFPTGMDGILTAEEVVNLDLQKTELVVLSACETGLGKVSGGEGVMGLQRAFSLAGARTSVASLWKVDDDATKTLMLEFYRNLKQHKMEKLAALREAQLTMIRQYDPKTTSLSNNRGLEILEKILPDKKGGTQTPDRLPPFFWAAFVLNGDWR